MSVYVAIKWLHIVSATILFGTGLGIAFFKWLTDRRGDVRAIRISAEQTVFADWIFTTPAGFVQLFSGLAMVHLAGYPITTGWVWYSLCLFALAGCCWLPVLWLQMRMRSLARLADDAGAALPPQYWAYARTWFWLGIPAFLALVVVYWLMVAKPIL